MDVSKILFITLLQLFIVGSNNNCVAQISPKQIFPSKSKLSLEGKISLDSLTQFIHKSSGIRFSFNSVKVKGSKEISFPKANYTLLEILQRIKKTTSLYYSFHSGYVVFQDNPPKAQHKPIKETTKIKVSTAKKNIPVSTSKITTKPKQDIEKRQAAKKNILLKQKVKEKKDTVTNADVNKPGQDTSINNFKISAGLYPAKQDTGFIDSAKTNQPKKNTIVIQPNRNSILKDTAKNFSAGKDKDTVIINKALSNSSIATTKNRIKGIKKGLDLHYGLQWDVNIPFYGFNKYFLGTNGENQFYNFLIPGLWVSKTVGKKGNEVLVSLKAAQQYLTGSKTVAIITGVVSPTDSTPIQRNKVVIKTNNITLGVQYNYRIDDRWSIGTGLNLHWQYSALVNQQTIRLQDGSLLSDSLYGINKSSTDWQYFKPSIISARVEVLYSFKKLQSGMAIIVPVTNFFQLSPGSSHPVNGHIFLRWRIK